MPKTAADLIAQAKSRIQEIAPKDAQKRAADGALFIDVRELDELENGQIPGAVHIPRGLLELQIGHHPVTKNIAGPVILYCKAGSRSALAADTLQSMGYKDVYSLTGGFGGWVEAGQPVESKNTTDEEE